MNIFIFHRNLSAQLWKFWDKTFVTRYLPSTGHGHNDDTQIYGTDYKTHIYTFTTSDRIPSWDSHLIIWSGKF